MLVLSRRKMEELRIGEDITIKILSIKGSVVKVGIEAPIETTVLRGELLLRDIPAIGAREQKTPAFG